MSRYNLASTQNQLGEPMPGTLGSNAADPSCEIPQIVIQMTTKPSQGYCGMGRAGLAYCIARARARGQIRARRDLSRDECTCAHHVHHVRTSCIIDHPYRDWMRSGEPLANRSLIKLLI